MVNALKFKDDFSHRVFFYADMHYRHNPSWDTPLWKLRGFNSVLEHDAAQIENWNATVTNEDTVFLLGDTVVGAGKESEQVFRNLLGILNYKIIYIMPGNHPAGYKQILKKDFMAFHSCEGVMRIGMEQDKEVYFIPNYFEIYVNGTPIVLSHYSILAWNGNAHGAWMLHGHSHGSLHKTDWVEREYYKGKVMDVGPEGTGATPISYETIRKQFKEKENLSIDHHSKETSSPFARK